MSGRTWARTLAARLEPALILLVCLLYAGAPPPAVNEPHYLGKAKHYWSPEWCAGDHFLESSDAHTVFYWTFGWTTQFLSLSQTAWFGRLLVWGLFAWSWAALVRRLTDRRGASLLSAIVLISLVHFGHLSGEWLIGGVEAKGFAYPLVFLAMARAAEGRWWSVWPLLGVASSFHILVGGWAVVACLIAWFLRRREEHLRFGALIPWLILGGLLSLPGLLPAIQLSSAATAEELREANHIYAIRRLSHHLIFACFAQWNPLKPDFNIIRPVSFALTVLVWWLVSRATIHGERMARVNSIVTGSLVIAGVAVVLDVLLAPSDTLRASVMRYYWFRLSDVMVPAGIALMLAVSWRDRRNQFRSGLLVALCATLLAGGWMRGDYGLGARPAAYRQQQFPAVLPVAEAAEIDEAWEDVCGWIRDPQNTPKASVFLTPPRQQSFNWLAQRPDVVTWKDVPQDALGLIAWWTRMEDIYPLNDSPWSDPEALANLVGKYGVTHVVWSAGGEAELPDEVVRLYGNDLFEVFAIE